MLYFSSDYTGLTNAQCPTGGHQRKILNPKEVAKGAAPEYEERLIIDCPVCENLVFGKDAASKDPLNIPQTAAEQKAEKDAEKEAMKHSISMAEAFAEMTREYMAGKA